MDLQRLLGAVEDAADAAGHRGVAGHLVHVAPAQQVDVQLGADALERGGQPGAVLLRRARVGVEAGLGGEQIVQDGRVMTGGEREPVANDHGLDRAVEEGGEARVLEAAHHDTLVDELILGPAQATQILGRARASGPGEPARR